MVLSALGGVISALLIAALDGTLAKPLPFSTISEAPQAYLFAALYVGIILVGTMWGAFRLAPAVMTYLLSIEILGGVFSSAVFLDEQFGLFEIGGTVFVIGAVLIEVLWTPATKKI